MLLPHFSTEPLEEVLPTIKKRVQSPKVVRDPNRFMPGPPPPPIMTREQFRKAIAPRYRHFDSTYPERIDWNPEKIVLLRAMYGFTQEEIAIPARVSVQTILAWENGTRKDASPIGIKKLQNSMNEALNPIYQAYMDHVLPWTTTVGYGSETDRPRLMRTLIQEDGRIRTQIGEEFRGVLITMPWSDCRNPREYWDYHNEYVVTGRRPQKKIKTPLVSA